MTFVVRIAMLTAVWLALWSDITVANVLSGVLVASCIGLLFDSWRPGSVVIRPIHAARFVLHFLVKLVHSSLVVARTAIAPGHRISTGIVALRRARGPADITPMRDASVTASSMS